MASSRWLNALVQYALDVNRTFMRGPLRQCLLCNIVMLSNAEDAVINSIHVRFLLLGRMFVNEELLYGVLPALRNHIICVKDTSER
jgi:hypothetical protein